MADCDLSRYRIMASYILNRSRIAQYTGSYYRVQMLPLLFWGRLFFIISSISEISEDIQWSIDMEAKGANSPQPPTNVRILKFEILVEINLVF